MGVEEKVKTYLKKIKAEDGKVNAFLYVNEGIVKEARMLDKKKKRGRLFGFVFGIKSNINVKGMPVSCASKSLKDYKGSFDSTVIKKIKEEDGLIIGMTNMDEFAAGSSGENSAFGPTQNPSASGMIPGGSSSGSAAAVAAGFCDVALGSDTGGSIRNPASHCGIVGVKPSYGMVSRYGLIDLAMSLDQIGPFAKNVSDASAVLNVISGSDERDTMTYEPKTTKKFNSNHLRIGVLKIEGVNGKIEELVNKRILDLEKEYGWKIEKVKVRHIGLAVQAYYPLVYSEFFSGTRKFDGRKYGKKIEETCGEEVLRRILGGSEITKAEFEGAYYRKALEVKEIIGQEFEDVFFNVDCIILPTVPVLPWRVGEGEKMSVEEVYSSDALTTPVNLAGCCAISLPIGRVEGIPVGMQIICAKGNDSKMLDIAKEVENFNLKIEQLTL